MVITPEKEPTEARILEEAAANLFKQSEALMRQGRDLRAESMRLRELAKLSPSELSEVKLAQRRRNFSACWDGWATCDRSKLSFEELTDIAVADHQRNFMACTSHYTTCDLDGLTSAEATSFAAGAKTAMR